MVKLLGHVVHTSKILFLAKKLSYSPQIRSRNAVNKENDKLNYRYKNNFNSFLLERFIGSGFYYNTIVYIMGTEARILFTHPFKAANESCGETRAKLIWLPS
jgi:hypothetical protein